jgi:hypothetical protein
MLHKIGQRLRLGVVANPSFVCTDKHNKRRPKCYKLINCSNTERERELANIYFAYRLTFRLLDGWIFRCGFCYIFLRIKNYLLLYLSGSGSVSVEYNYFIISDCLMDGAV